MDETQLPTHNKSKITGITGDCGNKKVFSVRRQVRLKSVQISVFLYHSDLASCTRVSVGALDAVEPFNALFLVFPPPFSSRLFGWELLSCLCSASNFLLLFCSSSFVQNLMKRSF